MKSLIIVESPAKARTIEKFLGRRFTVKASKGHVRDLPKSKLGVDINGSFTPHYITIRGKGEILKELKAASKKADHVYLATDPDREGEAISWHLAKALGLAEDRPVRVVFHEITKEAVGQAIRSPRAIDPDLVDAQQARRVLDRLVGYQLSPLLWRKVRRGLSAGRVQSVALRLIVDRERERAAFEPQEYWSIDGLFRAGEQAFEAHYFGRLEAGKEAPVKEELGDSRSVEAVMAQLKDRDFSVRSISRRRRKRRPAPPFTTSTLQQEAARKLGFSVRKTMSLAQGLYEGIDLPQEGRVGLITYMRTDSTRIADQAKEAAHRYIIRAFGSAFAVPSARKAKAAPGAQEAHEAIRPTDVEWTPDRLKTVLSKDQIRLYRLVWDRFVASQMSAADLEVTGVDLVHGACVFRASGTVVKFPGFLSVYDEGRDDVTPEETGQMPELSEGQQVLCDRLDPKQHFTEPPARYSEAMLVKALEERGIGRPSTYVPIIQTILDRGYVVREQKRFAPTDLGRVVVDLLAEHFPQIVDPEFTAQLEARLDEIEEGDEPWQKVLADFYAGFSKHLQKAEEEIGGLDIKEEETDIPCDKCGRMMIVKYGRFGKFLACPGFPDCKNTKPYLEPTGAHCPECGGDLVARRTKKGRRFYGCANYPQCTFTIWQRPVPHTCPSCGSLMVERRRRGGPAVWACSKEDCDYEEAAPQEQEG